MILAILAIRVCEGFFSSLILLGCWLVQNMCGTVSQSSVLDIFVILCMNFSVGSQSWGVPLGSEQARGSRIHIPVTAHFGCLFLSIHDSPAVTNTVYGCFKDRFVSNLRANIWLRGVRVEVT